MQRLRLPADSSLSVSLKTRARLTAANPVPATVISNFLGDFGDFAFFRRQRLP